MCFHLPPTLLLSSLLLVICIVLRIFLFGTISCFFFGYQRLRPQPLGAFPYINYQRLRPLKASSDTFNECFFHFKYLNREIIGLCFVQVSFLQGMIFSRGDLSWEGGGTLPQNSYKPLRRRTRSVQWLARSFSTNRHTLHRHPVTLL